MTRVYTSSTLSLVNENDADEKRTGAHFKFPARIHAKLASMSKASGMTKTALLEMLIERDLERVAMEELAERTGKVRQEARERK